MLRIPIPGKKRRRRSEFARVRPGASPGSIHVDEEAAPPRIHLISYGPDALEEHDVADPAEIPGLLRRNAVTWINVDGLGDAETVQALGEIFSLHPLALEDVVNVFQRAKVEAYSDHLFVVVRMPHLTDELRTEQISLFLGESAVLTFQEEPGDCFEPVRERLRAGRAKIRGSGSDYLAYALVDAVIDSYFPVLERYGELLAALEEETLEEPHPELPARLQRIKRDLIGLRRATWPHREAINQLQRDDHPLIGDDTRLFLRDCYDHAVQLIDLTESYREIASGLMDFYLSVLSHKMNEVMKVLTIIATIFIPLGFIAGLYGMNFDPAASPWNMPELGWRWGYPYALGVMAIIAGGMLIWFRRKGWLGKGAETAPGSEDAPPTVARPPHQD